MASKSNSPSQIISLPKGGGALHGLGEKFSPDLHTGTGNFTVPVALPPGRNGFQPQLNLVYSTGNGNGPFGLGWSLNIPGVSRKTSKGIPKYRDNSINPEESDIFILSGAEDLVMVAEEKNDGANEGETHHYYRPRTEGLFARIKHVSSRAANYWEVRSKDGLISYYGKNISSGGDPPVIADPSNRSHIFAWRLSSTEDPFGNRIEYEYERDSAEEGPHRWDQIYLRQIRYADYTENNETKFLISVVFVYEDETRPDPFSEYRSGFEIRTRKRCSQIIINTHAEKDRKVRSYCFKYENDSQNGVSLLKSVKILGHDEEQVDEKNRIEELPSLHFDYTRFEPETRKFVVLQGTDFPASSLSNQNLELVDLFGNGLPDIIEMNGYVRYWRNLGGGRFDRPRMMQTAPAMTRLSDPGVQLIDADGDGRADLLVTNEGMSGYYPLTFEGGWDRRSFQKYEQAPSFNLEDPEVRLIDLDGDGVTDAIRSGTRMECFFNDPQDGWNGTRFVERKSLEEFPNINFSDTRVKWADMTGDGMQDIILIHDGNIEYWPNLGYGNWGKQIHTKNSPRFPYGYDPKRILVGDVDGDGLADVVYVDYGKVTLWINQSGNRWSDPIEIQGTPPVSDMDAVRLADIFGNGISGVLWTKDAVDTSRSNYYFLDFTGSVKPYLLNEMDNHIGAVTRIEYAPSTRFYLEDQKRPATRWKTFLPFPVQVVARVEVIDEISKGKLTTEYRYHHGYWDGAEREFRGFGLVEQYDTETFENYNKSGLHGDKTVFKKVEDLKYFSPPTLTKTWFHQGPVGEEFGDWEELDRSLEYWRGDPQMLRHTEQVNTFLRAYASGPKGRPSARDRRIKRDALRTMRGSILRTELYALDGTLRQDRPYTVTEHAYGLKEIEPPDHENKGRVRIFFPYKAADRTTQWERGNDPMTQFSFIDEYDEFGQPRRQTQIACPRGWRSMDDKSNAYLATRTRTEYALPIDPGKNYIHDRVAKTTTFEITNKTTADSAVNDALRTVLEIRDLSDNDPVLQVIAYSVNFYDGNEFTGRSDGKVDQYGALVRTQSLVLTEEILQKAYGTERPPYLTPATVNWTDDYPQEFRGRLPQSAGYLYRDGSTDPRYITGYYVLSKQRKYDFQENSQSSGRGLVRINRDALNHDTTIRYDHYQLLPASVKDPAGLETSADHDYRTMQPRRVTDPNGNETEFRFTPLGLLKETWVKGKPGKTEGDCLRPSARIEYEFLAYESSSKDNREPIFIRTIRQVHHDTESDVPEPERSETIETREYSDGFGRIIQTRTQGEEVHFGNATLGGGETILPTDQKNGPGTGVVGRKNTDSANPNVTVSGWQVYDNKGRVVEKYEPFFDTGWRFQPEEDSRQGVSVKLFYDPRGQVIRTVNPDGSEQRVVHGVPGTIAEPVLSDLDLYEPTPWEAYTYDPNDNAGRTHSGDSTPYQNHRNTPSSILIDSLGRTLETVQRNGADPTSDWYRTQSTYDLRGNVLEIRDALNRSAFRHVYDLANRPLRIESIDAGIKKTMLDVRGNTIEVRDSKGALILHAYDHVNRPTQVWARNYSNEPVTLRSKLDYGDAGVSDQPVTEREASKAKNLLGKLFLQHDEAGLIEIQEYDFKGNVLEKTRQVISDNAVLSGEGSPVDWSDPIPHLLDQTSYATSVTYDGLNRIRRIVYPKDVEGNRKELQPHYNRAGALEKVTLDGAVYVERIAYNAKGQRTFITYGNGTITRYAYDPKTFRLARMRTEKYQSPLPADLTYHPAGSVLQDFAYSYDLAGNILKIRDRTPGCGVVNTSLGTDALDRVFTYDPIYRLITATGRESKTISNPRPWADDPRQGFNSGSHGTPNQDNAPNLTAPYKEDYSYDPAGNMLSLRHSTPGMNNGWTRHFGMGGMTPDQWDSEWKKHLGSDWMNPPSNRPTHVGDNDPATHQTHFFDENGNLIRETSSRHFDWDHSDRMKAFRIQNGTEPSVHARYLYDAAGQRVKKLVQKQGGEYEVTMYIDGIFEYHQLVNANGTHRVENNSLHMMDDQSRIALVRVGDPFPGEGAPEHHVTYHLGDHLGSSSLVISADGAFINREEYFPYGETSFGSFARKRYRFTGKERDEESGLYYHGARYYAPSLGRWCSCDPLGALSNNTNLFVFVAGNPLARFDPEGKADKKPPEIDPDMLDPEKLMQKAEKVPLEPSEFKVVPQGGQSGHGPGGEQSYEEANAVRSRGRFFVYNKKTGTGSLSTTRGEGATDTTTLQRNPRTGKLEWAAGADLTQDQLEAAKSEYQKQLKANAAANEGGRIKSSSPKGQEAPAMKPAVSEAPSAKPVAPQAPAVKPTEAKPPAVKPVTKSSAPSAAARVGRALAPVAPVLLGVQLMENSPHVQYEPPDMDLVALLSHHLGLDVTSQNPTWKNFPGVETRQESYGTFYVWEGKPFWR